MWNLRTTLKAIQPQRLEYLTPKSAGLLHPGDDEVKFNLCHDTRGEGSAATHSDKIFSLCMVKQQNQVALPIVHS